LREREVTPTSSVGVVIFFNNNNNNNNNKFAHNKKKIEISAGNAENWNVKAGAIRDLNYFRCEIN
jgi:hypothetical protein